MIKRPRPGETVNYILEMQEEFLKKLHKGELQPSTQIIKATQAFTDEPSNSRAEPSSLFDNPGYQKYMNKETNIEFKEVSTPQYEVSPIMTSETLPIVGNIIERNTDCVEIDEPVIPMPNRGFPKVYKHNSNYNSLANVRNEAKNNEHLVDLDHKNDCAKKLNLPSKSHILSELYAEDIHKANIKILQGMSEMEILEEQEKLKKLVGPKLLEFLKKIPKCTNSVEPEVEMADVNTIKTEKIVTSSSKEQPNNLENYALSSEELEKWLHIGAFEKDKMEWMKVIETGFSEPEGPYEARFDFNGFVLPYSVECTEKNRVLFHHAKDPNRPGYTIEELFVLSQSNVLQQRVIAYTTLANIIECYHFGNQKDVIDNLPITKLMFLLRFAIDDNSPLVLIAALKAMRNLICNKFDEMCLDTYLGTSFANCLPMLRNSESLMKDLELDESDTKDYQIAEADLIAGLARTNIIQRCCYILQFLKYNVDPIQSILKILVRLAQHSVTTAKNIISHEPLMHFINKHYAPNVRLEALEKTHPNLKKMVLPTTKLLKSLIAMSKDNASVLICRYGVLETLKTYIDSQVSNSDDLEIQTEVFTIMIYLLSYDIASKEVLALHPVLMSVISRCFNGINISDKVHPTSSTHAGAVLQLLNKSMQKNWSFSEKSVIYHMLYRCTEKWLSQFFVCKGISQEHCKLLSSVLDCCVTFCMMDRVHADEIFPLFSKTCLAESFEYTVKLIQENSSLLSGLSDKDLYHIDSFHCLGTTITKDGFLPIINTGCSYLFMSSLAKLLKLAKSVEIKQTFAVSFCSYLTAISNENMCLIDNWFTRIEINFVFNLISLCTDVDLDVTMMELVFCVSNKLCYMLRSDQKCELMFLFDKIIFNKEWFSVIRQLHLLSLADESDYSLESSTADLKLCYSKFINTSNLNMDESVILENSPILPRDWIYLPIVHFYTKHLESETVSDQAKKVKLATREQINTLLECCLEWILLSEMTFGDLIEDIDITDRFCRLLCVFLCDNSLFLEKRVKHLLRGWIKILFQKSKKKPFNFDKPLNGLSNFQDFYKQLLEHFQAVSYGDHNFAACVLVPIAQQHNVLWRRILWSEYAGCLRALNCPEDMLAYDLRDYMHPIETDESLVMCYSKAINQRLVFEDSIVGKIALHHIRFFRNNRAKAAEPHKSLVLR